jgi:SAM-dependent methyltransferase
MTNPTEDSWDSSHAYEQYVGRWSGQVADRFLEWLALPAGLAWADIGCGTGALVSSILTLASPASATGIDASSSFVSHAQERARDPRAHFLVGDATRLPWKASCFDVSVSSLVLNFVQDPDIMTQEMTRVTKPGGGVAVYVWDYAGGMQMMRHFWDAANTVSPGDINLDEAERFPLCQPEPLQALFERNRLKSVSVHSIEIPTVFQNFDDYWRPFLGSTGPAPAYLAKVSDDVRERIRSTLESQLAPQKDSPIVMSARAWAVRGTV